MRVAREDLKRSNGTTYQVWYIEQIFRGYKHRLGIVVSNKTWCCFLPRTSKHETVWGIRIGWISYVNERLRRKVKT